MTVRTLAFYHWIFPGGGAETVTCNLAPFFAEKGIRMILFTRQLVGERLTEQMRRYFDLRPLPDTRYGTIPVNVDYLCETLRKERVDCLIVQGAIDFPFEAVARQTDTRIVFCLHNTPFWELYDLKHKGWSDLSYLPPRQRLEFILLRRPVYRLTHKLEHRYGRKYGVILSCIDRFVALCPAYRREFEERIRKWGYPGSDFPSENYDSILNPLLPPEEPVDVPKEKMVLYAGRFQRIHKRVDRLLRIWQKVEAKNPEWRLVLVGDGEETEGLKRLCKRLGLRRVEFAGFQTDVAPYYRRAAFVCLTSNFEGMPMCLTEGQQYGTIPVSFDSYAGIREITCDGKAGIVVPAYDLRKYADALDAALKDEPMQERMRRACYAAARRYTPEAIGREWLRLFDGLDGK